jgi:hypothetical protein
MKETAQKQLQLVTSKYSWVPRFALKNMRLLLLLLFAALAGYLVIQINSLVNSDSVPAITDQTTTDTPAATASSSISKTPSEEVLSTFNELTVQDVQLDSNFDSNRNSPF